MNEPALPTASRTSVQVVQAMWRAGQAGDVEEMLRWVHPRVVWQPLTRPGLSVYHGHAGTREMLDTIRRVHGEVRVNFTDFHERDDGRVIARGHTVRITDAGEVPGPDVEVVFTLADGLVIGMESSAQPDP